MEGWDVWVGPGAGFLTGQLPRSMHCWLEGSTTVCPTRRPAVPASSGGTGGGRAIPTAPTHPSVHHHSPTTSTSSRSMAARATCSAVGASRSQRQPKPELVSRRTRCRRPHNLVAGPAPHGATHMGPSTCVPRLSLWEADLTRRPMRPKPVRREVGWEGLAATGEVGSASQRHHHQTQPPRLSSTLPATRR